MDPTYAHLYEALTKVDGFIYPNELDLAWSVLIVLYPYITGLVAGAFILASLERVFKVKALKPTYTIALLTSFSFLLVATMPLIFHLGQPFRFYEILTTPHLTSAMAVFGFVYLWYLMAVLLLEIWFDYRHDLVIWSQQYKGLKGFLYKIFTLGIKDISDEALTWDRKLGYAITLIGIPSAFLLHGYVGFIFGSVKANPWWSTTLMPVIFLFSAMVSGIALVLVIYMVVSAIRKNLDMKCLDTIAKFLFFSIILDFSLEILDQIHRFYVADEAFDILYLLMSGKLYITLIGMQGIMGTIVPILILGTLMFYKPKEGIRKALYAITGVLVLIGIFFMRWNVVIGGQLFSKSLSGFTSYKLGLIGAEGFLSTIIWMVIPFIILTFLLWLLPPWKKISEHF